MKKKVCSICNKELGEDEMFDFQNAAVIGEYIHVQGHKTCVDNVNNIVVVPNRVRVNYHIESLKKVKV